MSIPLHHASRRERRAPARGFQPASGSTGHRPVAPGNLPGATAARSRTRHAVSKIPCAFPVPFGGSPDGTGRLPVPPPTPTALHHSAQGCRVREATLGQPILFSSTLKGLNPIAPDRCNPFRVETDFAFMTQGSSSLATLGWRMEPRWGSTGARGVSSEVAERRPDGSRGLQPTDANPRAPRRVATPEHRAITTPINRRYATNNFSGTEPWAKAHGYLHSLATRGTFSPSFHSLTISTRN